MFRGNTVTNSWIVDRLNLDYELDSSIRKYNYCLKRENTRTRLNNLRLLTRLPTSVKGNLISIESLTRSEDDDRLTEGWDWKKEVRIWSIDGEFQRYWGLDWSDTNTDEDWSTENEKQIREGDPRI